MEEIAVSAAMSEQTPSRQSLQVQSTEWDNSLQTKVENIVENMTQQQIYLSEIQTQVIAESDRLASSNQALYDLVEKLKKELAQKGLSADDCQQRVNELEREISQLELDIKNKDEKISGLNETIAELESRISDLEEQLKDKQDEMDKMLEEQGLDRDKAIAAKQAEIDQLLKDKAALSTKIDELTNEVENLKPRITQLEENLLNAQQDLKQEKESKKKLEQDQKALRNELTACNAMIEQLKKELVAMGERNNEIVLQKEALQEAIQNLKKKISDQLDFIMAQKQKLIDAPVAELKKHTDKMKHLADQAEQNFESAQSTTNISPPNIGYGGEEGFFAITPPQSPPTLPPTLVNSPPRLPPTSVEVELSPTDFEEEALAKSQETSNVTVTNKKPRKRRDEAGLATWGQSGPSTLDTGRRGNLKKLGGAVTQLPPIY